MYRYDYRSLQGRNSASVDPAVQENRGPPGGGSSQWSNYKTVRGPERRRRSEWGAERGGVWGGGVTLPVGRGLGRGLCPSAYFFIYTSLFHHQMV